MKDNKITWGTIIPLIGGMTIGNKMATGQDPEFFLSYEAFASNDQHIRKYMPHVKYLIIDENTNEFKQPSLENPDLNSGLDNLEFQGVDFISSVCPCAGLSMMNASTKSNSKYARGSNAVQNQWMYKSTEFVLEKIKPKVLFGENAPGLYTNLGQGVVERLREIGKNYGYSFSLYKTNTLYHGIPQRRERTFYFFWNSPTVPILDYYRRETKSLKDYLAEIPKNATFQNQYAGLSEYLDNNPFIRFMKYKEGEKWRQVACEAKTATSWLVRKGLIHEMIQWLKTEYPTDTPNLEKVQQRTLKYLEHINHKLAEKKGWWDGSPHFFNNTINAVIARTMQTSVHPVEDRAINLREFMHLMGLPHDFEIPNKNYFNHIAQNVPTTTARDMTYEVIKFIKGQAKMSEVDFLKQNNSAKNSIQGIETPIKQLF